MTSTEPGFALNKGYPYARVESEAQLPNRVRIVLEADNVITLLQHNFSIPMPEDDLQAFADFLMGRCFDFQEALKTAENQIKDLLTDDAFVPQELGFELISKPETIHDIPARIYASKYDDQFILYREMYNVSDAEIDTTRWIIQKKIIGTDKFDKIPVRIPNHRIAYALFYALGVKMEPEQSEGEDAPVVEEAPAFPNTANIGPPIEEEDYNESLRNKK